MITGGYIPERRFAVIVIVLLKELGRDTVNVVPVAGYVNENMGMLL